MKKSLLIKKLQSFNNDYPVKIWTYDPDQLWHAEDDFDIEGDSQYNFNEDQYIDCIVLDSVIFSKKQTVSSVIKDLNKEPLDLDVRLLEYNQESEEMYEVVYTSEISVELVENQYILIRGRFY